MKPEVSATFRRTRGLLTRAELLLARSGIHSLGAMLGLYSMSHPRIVDPSQATRTNPRSEPLLRRALLRWNAFTLARWGLEMPQVARLIALVFAGLVVAAGSGAYIWEVRARALQAELTTLGEAHVKLLRSSTLKSLEALQAIAAFMESAGPTPSREAFRVFVQGPLSRLPEVRAFEWIPVVSDAERDALERATQQQGYPDYHFTELDADGVTRLAGRRARYFPVLYVAPEDINLPALGLDLGAHPARMSALMAAADSGKPVATSSIRLAQETEAGQVGFLVFVRVMDRSAQPAVLRGFALGAFRIRDIVGPALARAAHDGLDVRITDSAEPGRTLYAVSAGSSAGPAAPERTRLERLDVFGRSWDVLFSANSGFKSSGSGLNAYAYPVLGLLLTLLIAGNTARGMQRTLEIERRVEARTEELSREVSIRRQTESALRIAEAKYRSIFENAIVGIFQTTPAGSYLDANPALARIYGYASREEFMASVCDVSSQLYSDVEQRSRFTAIMRERGSVEEFVSQVRRKDDSLIWIAETAVAVNDPDGSLLYYEGSVQDVTERVLAEQSRRRDYEWLEARVNERTRELAAANHELQAEIAIRKQAQEEAAAARRAQSQFLANMSHEIRTPLNAILGYSQVLQQQSASDALEREALHAISQSGQHLLTLVGDVMDLSKIEAGHVEVSLGDFNLGRVISSLSFMFQNRCDKKGLKLRVEGLGASPWWVRGDEVKLRQVLINLLGNAVKFTTAGEVRMRIVPEENGSVRFEVIDTGIGIEREAHRAIFRQFVQAESPQRSAGVGLGLAISRRLVEVMGGELSVLSTPGWGSNFHFSLRFERPLAVRASQTKAHYPSIRISPETPCRALVVDDLEVNRNVMKHLLSALGCTVTVAGSGPEALSIVERGRTQIVFLDVLMPGMDGIQVAQALRKTHGREIRIVASSASIIGTRRDAYLAAGFDEFIPKPFRIEQITDCLASLLKTRFVADAPEQAEVPPLLPEGLSIPEEIVEEIRAAAELYQVTLLRAALGRLESCGPREHALAEQLRASAVVYDMRGIVDTLERLMGNSREPAA